SCFFRKNRRGDNYPDTGGFRDITVYLRDGSFSSVRELESSITTFLALRNAQPTRYVWNAKGEDILNKIQRARAAMTTQA
ncbi:hypothetical protein RYA95_27900, partial [Pseudomonas syringae pv. actinidiae]|nr:hypothetical protein [Pseudomonas syringae pv. actinidiae]